MAPLHACFLGFQVVVVDPDFISHNNSFFCFKASQKFLAGINTLFFQFCSQLAWHPPCRHFMELQNIMDVWCADPWLTSRCAAISFTITRQFSFMMASTAVMASGVTTWCAWPGRGETVTELTPFMNFLVHSYTCCSDRYVSTYQTFIRRWISMDFTPSLLKKRMTERLLLWCMLQAESPSLHYYCTVMFLFLHFTATCWPLFKPWVSLLSTYKTIELCFKFLSHF